VPDLRRTQHGTDDAGRVDSRVRPRAQLGGVPSRELGGVTTGHGSASTTERRPVQGYAGAGGEGRLSRASEASGDAEASTSAFLDAKVVDPIFGHLICNPSGKPAVASFLMNGKCTHIELYNPGSGKSVYDAERAQLKCYKFLERILLSGRSFVTTDFKKWWSALVMPLPKERLNAFDLSLSGMGAIKIGTPLDKIEALLEVMSRKKCQIWQNIIANAAVVYESLERDGVMVGWVLHHPIWSQHTFSGRSKTLGFNLQGATDNDHIRAVGGSEKDLLVHFDWRAADIRIAAILSGDTELQAISAAGDPYDTIMQKLNAEDEIITRPQCKQMFLSSINALRCDGVIEMFPTLRDWIARNARALDQCKPLRSILGRPFRIEEGRNERSVFNATMQGSIAHAMQLTIRRIWESDCANLLAEIHDSVVVNCDRNRTSLLQTINDVAAIMCRPFAGVLNINPSFQVRVSIGKHWKRWKPFRLYTDVGEFVNL